MNSNDHERRATIITEVEDVADVAVKIFLAQIVDFDLSRPPTAGELHQIDVLRTNCYVLASNLVMGKYAVMNNKLQEAGLGKVETEIYKDDFK